METGLIQKHIERISSSVGFLIFTYLVVDLTGQRAREILFKSESLRRHTPQSEVPWKRASGKVEYSIGVADRNIEAEPKDVKPLAVATQQVNAEMGENVSPTLTAANGTSGSNRVYVVLNDQGGDVMNISENITGTLRAEAHGHALVVVDSEKKVYGKGPGMPNFPYYDEQSPKLTCSQQMAVMIENHPMDSRVTLSGDVCQTLSARMGTGGGNVPLVMETNDEKIYVVTDRSHTEVCINQSPTLVARDYKSPNIVNTPQPNSIVRRLTPLECSRLQGFPDRWVDGESDAAQYKALGNSVALPCVNYVMSGVVDVLDPIE